jgi:hypothetical protein
MRVEWSKYSNVLFPQHLTCRRPLVFYAVLIHTRRSIGISNALFTPPQPPPAAAAASVRCARRIIPSPLLRLPRGGRSHGTQSRRRRPARSARRPLRAGRWRSRRAVSGRQAAPGLGGVPPSDAAHLPHPLLKEGLSYRCAPCRYAPSSHFSPQAVFRSAAGAAAFLPPVGGRKMQQYACDGNDLTLCCPHLWECLWASLHLRNANIFPPMRSSACFETVLPRSPITAVTIARLP